MKTCLPPLYRTACRIP